MKTLTLLRHAKSSWDDPVARDFDRPLNGKGQRAGLAMGRYLRGEGLAFDHVVASPAVRIVETVEQVEAGYGCDLAPIWDRRVYLASAGSLIDIVHELPAQARTALLIGHNPGLEDLIFDLVPDDGSSPLRDEVEVKFPTATYAVLECAVDRWSDLAPGCARLVHMQRPRDIDPTLGPLAP